MNIYEKIKELLKERGVTIKQLSTMTGISYNTLYAAIKRKQKTIALDNAIKISDALNIPLNDILIEGSVLDEYKNEIEALKIENEELKATIRTLLKLVKAGD